MKTIQSIYLIGVLILATPISQGQRTYLDNYIGLFRMIRKLGTDVIGKTSSPDSRLFQKSKSIGLVQDPVSPDTPFPCDLTNARSSEPPTSVNKVRPGDIDVVAAMGDSLSAGIGSTATMLLHLMVDNRGIAWTGGGQGTWREFLTLPNILKVFNPKLFGYSLSDSLSTDPDSQFNVAEMNAMSIDMPYMARVLVKRFKTNPKVDIKNHWKLVTMMIGANDFCTNMCYKPLPRDIIKEHRTQLIETLRILRDNLPRTIVVLVNAPQLEPVVSFSSRNFMCDVVADFACTCLFGLRWRHLREEFYTIMREYEDAEDEIVAMPEFDTDDFTVVTQPCTRNMSLPLAPSGKSDPTFLSTDCFHLTQKAYARAANALWNNVMEPVGSKTPRWRKTFDTFACPTPERPYIATRKNS